MHIVFVLTTGEGGIPHYTAELANSLRRTGNEITVVKPAQTTADEFFDDEIQTREWIQNASVSFSTISELDVSPIEVGKSFTSMRKLSQIPELDPDVIHFTHKPHSYLWPVIPSIDTDAPILETRHETENENLFRVPGRDIPMQEDPKVVAALNVDSILRHTFSGVDADGYIVHTKDNTADMAEKFPDSPVETIPHGAFSIFSPEEGDEQTSETGPTVLFFGNINGAKDPHQLVEATVQATDELPELTTVIAGSGALPEKTEAIIDANPELFELRNEFIPNEDVPDLFANADVVAVPHRKQHGHSGTMTIAFSHGKPVVSTNVGEFEELVRRSGAGYTVDPGDVTAMKESLCALLTNPDLREVMGENSRAMADQLSWDTVAEETEQFYRENGA